MNPWIKNKKLPLGLVIFGLITAIFLAAIVLPKIIIHDASGLTTKCGIENCHGVDITCGPNIPEICTGSYAFGDRCRQYARCAIINEKCQLVKNEKFEKCKSCVEKCSKNFKDDIVKLFNCESRCAE